MIGKTCMVTGANSGVGRVAALELAKRGANVVMICRNAEKAEPVRKEIISRSGGDSVELMLADLSLLREVRRLASEFLARHAKLHVLVNNAGSNFPRYEETAEGFERTIALNYYSPFLLTNLLLPALEAGAPSRVVNVASVAHFGGELNLDDLNGRGSGRMFGLRAYSRSKLALVLFTYELARRLQGTNVTSNCLHPGAVRTNIWSHSGVMSPFVRFASLFMKSPAKGAETIVHLATSPDVDGVSGKYFDDMQPRLSSRASYDLELARRLWDLSARATGVATP